MISRISKNQFEINGRKIKVVFQNMELLLPIKVSRG